MTTKNNITDKININTQMTELHCSVSTDYKLQDLKDIKSLDKDNLTKMTTKCSISDDLTERNPEEIKDTNAEKKEHTLPDDQHSSDNSNIEENLKINNSLNEMLNEKENTGLNEQDMSVDGTFDKEALEYSRAVNNEENYDEDMLIVYLDESLENLQNESLENAIEPVSKKNVLNDKEKSVQDWSALHDLENSLEEGEIPDETSDSVAHINDLHTLNDKQKNSKDCNFMQNEIVLRNEIINKKMKPMQCIFGLLCMSFNNGPYEFTLTTMTHYISGKCDRNNDWLKNLDSYIKQLNITNLHVSGKKQANIIASYVYSAKIHILYNRFLPKRETGCPNCSRYGCSKYKATCILHHNFKYSFKIPCTFTNTVRDVSSWNNNS